MKTSIPVLAIPGIRGGALGTLAMMTSVSHVGSESTQYSMKITPEQETELAKLPVTLRSLIETELASGNGIAEIGHSFPAPPAGAYIMLANKEKFRRRGL